MANQFIHLRKIKDHTVLYHYTKSNGVQGILKDRAFYATKSNFLNDINEMVYTLKVVDEVLEEIPKKSFRHLLRERFARYSYLIEKQSYFVTSFSVDPDSITLWAEFGDKTGYNLEFDGRELVERIRAKRKIVYHGYLIYSRKEQRAIVRRLLFDQIPRSFGMSLMDLLERTAADPKAADFEKFCTRFLKTISIYSLFFKQEEFAVEREYRMVFKEKDPKEILLREKDGFLLPYILVDIGEGKTFVKRITVAPKNHVDLARAGMEFFTRHYGYEVEVCLSRIHLRY